MFAPGDGELDLVARVLSAGKTSRLYKRLVYDAQIATDVVAYQSSMQLGSVFEIQATAQSGKTADQLLTAIDEELKRFRDGGVQDPELARARTSFLSGMVFDLERNASRANMLNTFNQYAGTPDYLTQDVARYQQANVESLRQAALKWLPADKRVITLVTPTKGAPLAGKLVATKGAK
jgi:predicted Zn-dependent peptidase